MLRIWRWRRGNGDEGVGWGGCGCVGGIRKGFFRGDGGRGRQTGVVGGKWGGVGSIAIGSF